MHDALALYVGVKRKVTYLRKCFGYSLANKNVDYYRFLTKIPQENCFTVLIVCCASDEFGMAGIRQ